MASPHVPVARALALPWRDRHVEGYLARQDPDLRIRRSAEDPRYYVLERRCRRRPPVHAGRRDESDLHIQARDGYVHVARVHPSYLTRPWRLVRALREMGEDLWVQGAARFATEEDYQVAWARESARRRRREEFRALAREAYDLAQRHGDGVTRPRVSNAGVPIVAPTRQQRRAAARASVGRVLTGIAGGTPRRERRAIARQGGRAS
jgi:hypothetical protein